jgi:diguanylate cyclase (GGDEF)-like protein/PAS domain S-box-containing protein
MLLACLTSAMPPAHGVEPFRSAAPEAPARKGEPNPKSIKIIDYRNPVGFPAYVSPRLYLNWPFAGLPSADEKMARPMNAALFIMEENTAAARLMGLHASAPVPLADLLKELHLPVPAFTLNDVWMRYRLPLISVLLAGGLIVLLAFRWFLTKQKLEAALHDVLRQKLQLHDSERKLSDILENVEVCIYLKDRQGRYLYANRPVRELFGAAMEDIVGRGDEVFFDAETQARLRDNDYLVLEQGQTLKTEETNLNLKDRRPSVYLSVKVPLRNEAGEIYALCGISTDITERKALEALREEAREEARSRLQKIASRGPGVVYQYRLRPDGSSCFPFASEALNAIYRLSPAQVREDAAKVFAVHHPDDYDGVVASILESAQNLTPWHHEYRVKFDDGTVHWLLGNSLPQREADGSTLWHGVITDITGHKRAEAYVAKTLSLLQATLDSTHDAILVVDLNNAWVLHNQQFIDLWQITSEMIAARDDTAALLYVLNQLEDPEGFLSRVRALYGDPEARSFDNLKFKDGRIVERYSLPQRIDGKVVGRVWSFRDVTERKQAEQALRRESEKNLALLHNASDGIHILDIDGTILEVSDSFCAMLGYRREEMIGMNVAQFSDDERMRVVRQQLLKPVRSQFETRHRRKDGRIIEVEVSSFPLQLDGKPVLFNSSRDITCRKLSEAKLYLAASVFTHAREGIMITALDGTIIEVNEAFSRITGYSRAEILGKNQRILGSGHQETAFYTDLFRDLLEKDHWSGEIWNRRKNGDEYAVLQTISAVRDAQGNARQYAALFSDITSLKQHEKQLEQIAHYDGLTGLPNRVLLADRLHQGMAQARRQGQRLAVVFLDLDGFKAINDDHGHEVGDQLLITLAARMEQTLRESDTLARLGGDEFVAVLLGLGDSKACMPMLARLLAAAAQPVSAGESVLQVSASLGVTFYPQAEDNDADQLLRQADQAMYQAKLAGKNRYHFFDAEQDSRIRGHHESLERIRTALAAHEFVLYYQPKVNMRTGRVIGAEALIRWQHPEKGLLPPMVFLPVIENHPLAVAIGTWAIDAALAQIESWRAAGLSIPVSVNVGARQLQQADFVEHLSALLAAHPAVKPGDLELEVLETSALEDLAHISKVIAACRVIGVSFALDDFGTGYSSLTYLKRLPITQIKLDQSFVRGMLEDPDDLAILEGVLGLATAFNRQVIAEGVETMEHGALLLQLGCELAQGYGIAYPMLPARLPGWAASWQPDPVWVGVSSLERVDLPLLFAGIEHRAWVAALGGYLKGEHATPPSLNDHECRLGPWLESDGQARYGAHEAFHAVKFLHKRVHALALELVELKTSDRNGEALGRVAELNELRDNLLEQLKVLIREKSALGGEDLLDSLQYI